MSYLAPDQAPPGSGWIIRELAEVRRRAAQGELPAFRRRLMFFDFAVNKVRVAPPESEAA